MSNLSRTPIQARVQSYAALIGVYQQTPGLMFLIIEIAKLEMLKILYLDFTGHLEDIHHVADTNFYEAK